MNIKVRPSPFSFLFSFLAFFLEFLLCYHLFCIIQNKIKILNKKIKTNSKTQCFFVIKGKKTHNKIKTKQNKIKKTNIYRLTPRTWD
jgi:hypothetical protein